MHPPLNIVDRTDELIAIEWLKENNFNGYAEHMEAAMDSMCFVLKNLAKYSSMYDSDHWSKSLCFSGTQPWSLSGSQSLQRSASRSRSRRWSKINSKSLSRSFIRSCSQCSSRS